MAFDGGDVGDERVHNVGPSPVKRGVPNGRRKGLGIEWCGHLFELVVLLPEHLVALVFRDKVHLVH